MRYFVTGSRGFAAGHIVENLLKKPDNFVVGIDCLYACASKTDPSNATNENYQFVKGDVNDQGLIAYLLTIHKFDIIIHLSAQSHVDTSFATPSIYAKDNFMATLNLLECVRLMPVALRPRIIHVSTDEVLGPSTESKAKHEDSLLLPTNVYSATKAASECLINAYKCSSKLQIIIVRPNNLISTRQYTEKCIPRFITLLKHDMPITIHGDGHQLRAFLDVADLASALDILIERGIWGQIYHVSSDYEISILNLAAKIAQIMGKTDTYKLRYVEDRAFNDVRYHIQSDALKNLGWVQKITFEESIQKIVPWYLDEKNDDYFIEKFVFPTQHDVVQPISKRIKN